jgi:hypothetical protein
MGEVATVHAPVEIYSATKSCRFFFTVLFTEGSPDSGRTSTSFKENMEKWIWYGNGCQGKRGRRHSDDSRTACSALLTLTE